MRIFWYRSDGGQRQKVHWRTLLEGNRPREAWSGLGDGERPVQMYSMQDMIRKVSLDNQDTEDARARYGLSRVKVDFADVHEALGSPTRHVPCVSPEYLVHKTHRHSTTQPPLSMSTIFKQHYPSY